MFTDVEFMAAKEKELVLKKWITFLKHGLKSQHFTKRLYEHLHLHRGYIAHYSRGNFLLDILRGWSGYRKIF